MGVDEVELRPWGDHRKRYVRQYTTMQTSTSNISSDRDKFKIEEEFTEKVQHPILEPLLLVIQGLMRFLPSNRMSAEEALEKLGHSQER